MKAFTSIRQIHFEHNFLLHPNRFGVRNFLVLFLSFFLFNLLKFQDFSFFFSFFIMLSFLFFVYFLFHFTFSYFGYLLFFSFYFLLLFSFLSPPTVFIHFNFFLFSSSKCIVIFKIVFHVTNFSFSFYSGRSFSSDEQATEIKRNYLSDDIKSIWIKYLHQGTFTQMLRAFSLNTSSIRLATSIG